MDSRVCGVVVNKVVLCDIYAGEETRDVIVFSLTSKILACVLKTMMKIKGGEGKLRLMTTERMI
jgi:hypothetical protein